MVGKESSMSEETKWIAICVAAALMSFAGRDAATQYARSKENTEKARICFDAGHSPEDCANFERGLTLPWD